MRESSLGSTYKTHPHPNLRYHDRPSPRILSLEGRGRQERVSLDYREGLVDKDTSVDKEIARARDAAYRHLSYRPRSRTEILRKLQEKGFSDPLVDRVLR